MHNITYRARVDGVARGALITYKINDTQVQSADPTMLPGRIFEAQAVLSDPKLAGMQVSIQWPYSANLHCEILVDDADGGPGRPVHPSPAHARRRRPRLRQTALRSAADQAPPAPAMSSTPIRWRRLPARPLPMSRPALKRRLRRPARRIRPLPRPPVRVEEPRFLRVGIGPGVGMPLRLRCALGRQVIGLHTRIGRSASR